MIFNELIALADSCLFLFVYCIKNRCLFLFVQFKKLRNNLSYSHSDIYSKINSIYWFLYQVNTEQVKVDWRKYMWLLC